MVKATRSIFDRDVIGVPSAFESPGIDFKTAMARQRKSFEALAGWPSRRRTWRMRRNARDLAGVTIRPIIFCNSCFYIFGSRLTFAGGSPSTWPQA